MSYTKLSHRILDSSVWQEPDHVRLVWITMLAMVDERGEVQASVPGLAARARVPMDQCLDALNTLGKPDQWSACGDEDGRRIVPVRGGWRLVSHEYYRSRDSAEKRELDRLRQQRHRQKQEQESEVEDGKTCHVPSRDVTPVTQCHAMSRDVTKSRLSDQIRSDHSLLERESTSTGSSTEREREHESEAYSVADALAAVVFEHNPKHIARASYGLSGRPKWASDLLYLHRSHDVGWGRMLEAIRWIGTQNGRWWRGTIIDTVSFTRNFAALEAKLLEDRRREDDSPAKRAEAAAQVAKAKSEERLEAIREAQKVAEAPPEDFLALRDQLAHKLAVE